MSSIRSYDYKGGEFGLEREVAQVGRSLEKRLRTLVPEFADLVVRGRPAEVLGFSESLIARGISHEALMLNLLGPTAQELGNRWVHDSANFLEVTLGVGRLNLVLRELGGIPGPEGTAIGSGREILLIPSPGEQHTLGLRILEELLRRDGWHVTNTAVQNLNELAAIISDTHFDIVGLSLSGEVLINGFLTAIQVVRQKSKNRNIEIIVGGQLFVERPELIKLCGADAFGADALASVALINHSAAGLVRAI